MRYSDMGDRPVLTKAEELAAWLRKDYDLLIRSQLPFVVRIASDTCRMWSRLDLIEECVSVGMIALCKCVREKFDASLGYRLSTYCHMPILREVREEIMRSQKREKRFLFASEYRSPRSGNREMYDESQGSRFVDSPSSVAADDSNRNDDIDELRSAIQRLPKDRQETVQTILDGRTCQSVGDELGISRAAVSARRTRALIELKGILSHA